MRPSFKQGSPLADRIGGGTGVMGSSYAGKTLQHLPYDVVGPNWQNLRQVDLMSAELHENLNAK